MSDGDHNAPRGTAFGITPDNRVISAAHFGVFPGEDGELEDKTDALEFVNEGCCRVVVVAHDDPALEDWFRAFSDDTAPPDRTSG